jgi:hypothetical protein
MADNQGFVNSSLPGLADLARVKPVLVEEALAWLGAPDPYWYNQELFGRKIEPYPGGWVILDYQPLRKKRSADELREANRLRQAKWRETHKKQEGGFFGNRDFAKKVSEVSHEKRINTSRKAVC